MIIHFLPEAVTELEAVGRWYGSIDVELAIAFDASFTDAISKIKF